MHLMLVNDDGIHAPGIRALCDAALAAGHRVSVCAPDCERSAASHAITIRGGLRAERIDFPGAETAYAASGTPADCARLGLYLIPGVDAVISGVNNGENQGGACIYSGTVAAAMEASMSGTPALAASLCAYNTHEYAAAAKLAVRVAEWMLAHPLPRGALYNLNVPALPYEEIRGVRAAKLASTYLDSPRYVETDTAEGRLYSYIHGVDSVAVNGPETDVMLTRAGYASLTQLTWDLRLNAPDPDPSDIEL
ncbi:MAG: 5'/3'-nucleotidase SurE [Candidatus Faecivicinus sp.]